MSWRPIASMEVLQQRACIYSQIRTFFKQRDVLEVETPQLSKSTNPDPQIASMLVHNQAQPLYLQTSPEFAMKRLLASGSGSIYQICHAFREAEKGQRHHPEFTLLEWYRVGFDYRLLMDELEHLIDELSGKSNIYRRVSYQQLFLERLGIDILEVDLLYIRGVSSELVPGTDTTELDFDQCLDLLLSLVIFPELKGYLFVFDYPISQGSLARASSDNPMFAERFELFYNDLELANGFSELVDARLQRGRFENDNSQRVAKGLPQHPLDEQLISALESGMPDCAGVALGLDRLLMVLLGLDSIDQALSFTD